MIVSQPKDVKEVIDFDPRFAIRVLCEPVSAESWGARQWYLARLLGWMTLDQRPGKRRAGSRRKLRKSNAKFVGNIVLMVLLDRGLKSPSPDRPLDLLASLFLASGGFAACQTTPRSGFLLKKFKKAIREIEYVFQIVEYMCRYALFEESVENHFERIGRIYGPAYFTIESAKSFVEESRTDGFGRRTISAIWEKYKTAAPYLYAFYGVMSKRTPRTADEAVDCIAEISSNQALLQKLFGVAAFATDVLKGKPRNVRASDFRDVPRVTPECHDFSVEELEIIVSTARDHALAE